MAARQTVFNSYFFKMAWVLWEEFSGNDRRNQSGKRLKDRKWNLSGYIVHGTLLRKSSVFNRKRRECQASNMLGTHPF